MIQTFVDCVCGGGEEGKEAGGAGNRFDNRFPRWRSAAVVVSSGSDVLDC